VGRAHREPNLCASIVQPVPAAEEEEEEGGPAPAALLAALREVEPDISSTKVHRSALGSRCLDLEGAYTYLVDRYGRSDLDVPLSAQERSLRVVAVPRNENPPQHLVDVWESLVAPSAARVVHFVATSYGGFAIARLLDTHGDEVAPRLGGIALADSSHVHDCEGVVAPAASAILAARALNWVTAPTPLGIACGAPRLHVPVLSAGTEVHAHVPGAVVDAALAFLEGFGG
jgi:pimeloyl-ACP methyl ester carboxylesterase